MAPSHQLESARVNPPDELIYPGPSVRDLFGDRPPQIRLGSTSYSVQ